MRKIILLSCLLWLLHFDSTAQQNSIADSAVTAEDARSVNAASEKLLESIRQHKTHEEIAGNYFDLAEQLFSMADFPRAEFYMNKAILEASAGNRKVNLPKYYRELARIQEMENKISPAIASYSRAADLSGDSLQKQLNRNDAIRLQHASSPQAQLQYLNMNSRLLSNTANQDEKLHNFIQTANTNVALNNTTPALENYRDALTTVDSTSARSVQIKSDMVQLMVASNDLPGAINLQKNVVAEAKGNTSVDIQVTQLRMLSSLYFKADSADAGLKILQDAYHLALEKGNVKQAKESLMALAAFYENKKQDEKAATLYREFLGQLDELLSNDSSLIDRKLFLINEGKIAQLEQQQAVKDRVIDRKSRSNYFLFGSVLLLSALLLLIVKAWLSIRKRNKQIALQSLRREMNPHFIFNSLNSVNQFIANNNEREANKYLSSYSNLMRNIMENSNKDYVSLATEIDQLKKYLELEKLRFPDKFDYELEVDANLSTEEVLVPNMLIQPNLENAIWHGLRYKESPGLLKVNFRKSGDRTVAIIDDNGIGLTESKKIKTKNQKLHESLGLKNVNERIRLLNDLYRADIRFDLEEKSGDESGVTVRIEW